ncbi:MAG: hypothetical protein EA423_02835 [Phycisphaerales bacterium]|nr:MAG: hypothetical protein EA423_02835 [Phycisphaerales bacterium]
MSARTVLGFMSGTSLDGLDGSIVRIEGSGLTMRASFVRGATVGLGSCAEPLRRLAEGEAMTARSIVQALHDFSRLHADLALRLLDGGRADLIVAHGQTLLHDPPLSWQAIDPAIIASATGSPVLTDLRGADLASGGQGAPISPLADFVFFADESPLAVLNLGGFANATLLGSRASGVQSIEGFDICACNQVLDAAARAALERPFDEGGAEALKGAADPEALRDLAALLEGQSRAGRSLGTGDEASSWVERWKGGLSPSDLCATAAEAVGGAVASRLAGCTRLLLAGGGSRNRALVAAISKRLAGATIGPTDSAGLPATFREAAAMAVLGALSVDGVPITLTRVTGSPLPPLAGSLTPAPSRPAGASA